MTSREYEVAICVLHDRIAQSIKAVELFNGEFPSATLNEFRMAYYHHVRGDLEKA